MAEKFEGRVSIRCTKCDQWFSRYRDYHKHVVLEHSESDEAKLIAGGDHDYAVRYYRANPQEIEKGMQVKAAEVNVFRGRIDLVGRDREGRLCIMDVTMGKDRERKIKQLKKYRQAVRSMVNLLQGVGPNAEIRLLILQPGKEIEEVY